MADNGSLIDWLSKLGIGKELNNIDILSGFTVNLTLSKVISNYTVKLQAANTASTRINNWNTVMYLWMDLAMNSKKWELKLAISKSLRS